MAGAAYLSAKAAYAVGAGLVQIYTAEENRTVLQELLPEAIISCYNETAGKPDDKELEKFNGQMLYASDADLEQVCLRAGF